MDFIFSNEFLAIIGLKTITRINQDSVNSQAQQTLLLLNKEKVCF